MSNLENQQEDSSKLNYIERFEKERTDWTNTIKDIAKRFKNIEDLVDVQVDLYSERQRALEYMHELQVLSSKLKKFYLSEWKKAYDALSMNEDFRYNEREKNKMAEEKTSASKLKLDILQTHIDFFKDSIKTIDNMIFGVKHRLEIEDFKRGNK